MKIFLKQILCALAIALILSGCIKAPPNACLRVYAKNNGAYYSVLNSYNQGSIYIGDTIKYVSCSSLGQSYTWHFGDGTSTTTTDTVVYHVYSGFTAYNFINIQLSP